uniref:Uncharacterized protein n=1 Tax=Plectus sambesii TaxID=2011161 RepID=A0A914VT38_9BILA
MSVCPQLVEHIHVDGAPTDAEDRTANRSNLCAHGGRIGSFDEQQIVASGVPGSRPSSQPASSGTRRASSWDRGAGPTPPTSSIVRPPATSPITPDGRPQPSNMRPASQRRRDPAKSQRSPPLLILNLYRRPFNGHDSTKFRFSGIACSLAAEGAVGNDFVLGEEVKKPIDEMKENFFSSASIFAAH